MEWQKKMGSCFGESGFVFAGETITEENAFELLSLLRKSDISWREAAIDFAQYLLCKKCAAQQIDEQIIRIQKMHSAWLK
jgi:hypothetical protein